MRSRLIFALVAAGLTGAAVAQTTAPTHHKKPKPDTEMLAPDTSMTPANETAPLPTPTPTPTPTSPSTDPDTSAPDEAAPPPQG